MMSVYFSLSLSFVLIIVFSVTFSFTWPSSFFVLLKINTHLESEKSSRSHNTFDVYFGSLDSQSKVPDIPSPSMCVSIQELSVSFNSQDQAPDDPCHVQDPQCAPHDWFSTSSPFSHVFPRLSIWFSTVPCQVSVDLSPSAQDNPVHTPTTGLHPFSRKDFDVYLEEVLSSQDLVSWISTSGTLARVSDAPRKKTRETSPDLTTTSFNQVIPRLFMKCHNHPLFQSFVRVWVVSLVLAFVVDCFFGCVFSPIHTVPPSMSVCMYHYIYLLVCIICLSGTWCSFIFKQHRLQGAI